MVAHIFLDPTFGCGHLANQTSPSSPSSDCSPSPKLLTVNDFSPTTPRVGTFCCCFFLCWLRMLGFPKVDPATNPSNPHGVTRRGGGVH